MQINLRLRPRFMNRALGAALAEQSVPLASVALASTINHWPASERRCQFAGRAGAYLPPASQPGGRTGAQSPVARPAAPRAQTKSDRQLAARGRAQPLTVGRAQCAMCTNTITIDSGTIPGALGPIGNNLRARFICRHCRRCRRFKLNFHSARRRPPPRHCIWPSGARKWPARGSPAPGAPPRRANVCLRWPSQWPAARSTKKRAKLVPVAAT